MTIIYLAHNRGGMVHIPFQIIDVYREPEFGGECFDRCGICGNVIGDQDGHMIVGEGKRHGADDEVNQHNQRDFPDKMPRKFHHMPICTKKEG